MTDLHEFEVLVPMINASYKVSFPKSTTIQTIITEVAKNVGSSPQYDRQISLDAFGLFEATNTPVNNTTPSVPTDSQLSDYLSQKKFSFEPIITPVKIRYPDKTERELTFPSHLTVSNLVEAVQPDNGNYDARLFATTTAGAAARGSVGIKMNPHRPLRTYRLKLGDVVALVPSVTNTGIWRSVAGNQQVAVIVSMPQPISVTKAMKLPANSPISRVKKDFLRKAYLSVPAYSYGLYARLDGNTEDMLMESMALNTVPLPVPIRLELKLKPYKARRWFGVDPSQLPMTNDDGIEIPEVLVILRDLLDINDGFRTEGIFRKAGSEIEMRVIKKKLEEDGGHISTKDVHSVATLIKRWFKELPNRLLAGVDTAAVVADPNLKTNLASLVSPFYAKLLDWLFRLCRTISAAYETSKMDPKNLAIVWGPAIVPDIGPVKLGDPISSVDFASTQHGVEIVEANLRSGAPGPSAPVEEELPPPLRRSMTMSDANLRGMVPPPRPTAPPPMTRMNSTITRGASTRTRASTIRGRGRGTASPPAASC